MSFFKSKRSKINRYARGRQVATAQAQYPFPQGSAEKQVVVPGDSAVTAIYVWNAGAASATLQVGTASGGTQLATQAVAAGARYKLAPTVNGWNAITSDANRTLYVSTAAAIGTADLFWVIEYEEVPTADFNPASNPAGLNRG